MTKGKTWFNRPRAALCLFTGAVIVSVVILYNGNIRKEGSGDLSYMITQRHYGIDAREMERSVAIPLEDALSSIPGIRNIVSSSENSCVRIYLRFRRDPQSRRVYESVREAAQRVYETLPPSAQRPEFGFSDESGIPVWTAAIRNFPSGDYLQKQIKPVFEGIDGIAEVEISGTGIMEIIAALDPEKIAEAGLDHLRIAEFMAMNDAFFSGGMIRQGNSEIQVVVDGRFEDIESIKDAPLYLKNDSVIRLRDIANIYETERVGDTISRLDGKQTAILSITASSGIDLRTLSRKINEKAEHLSSGSLEFSVLYDQGQEEAEVLRSVLLAALEASLLVAVASFILVRGKNRNILPGLISAASIPAISVVSAALLSCLGFPPDRRALAGISIGIGSAADAVLLSADRFGRTGNISGKKRFAGIAIPLVSGAATTGAALFPLLSFSETEEITVIAWALGVVTFTALAAALIILPPLLLACHKPEASSVIYAVTVFGSKLRRYIYRFLAMIVTIGLKKPALFPIAALLVSCAALVSIFIVGTDVSAAETGNVVYARVEFEAGLRKEECDRRMASWAAALKNDGSIKAVQTSSRIGSGQIIVTFDSKKITANEVRSMIRSPGIPGGYIYIPEPSGNEKIWEIKITGDLDEKCRELAQEAAILCNSLPFVLETTLNFREGNPGLSLAPQRERLGESDVSFSTVADAARRMIHGPVIYKRITQDGEVDVRLKFSDIYEENYFPLKNFMNFPVGPEKIIMESLTYGIRGSEPSVIRREDRLRVASFSIRTRLMDPKKAMEKINGSLKQMVLPPGYKIIFDPDAIHLAEKIYKVGWRFVLSLIVCYMVMAAINESFGFPLLILAAVPPSLGVPILILALSGTAMTASAACSLVAVSGMTVNASIVAAGELRRIPEKDKGPTFSDIYHAIRRCFPVLISTSGTTIIGSLPFLFLAKDSGNMLRCLSLVTIFGIGASLVCSLIVIPSLFILYRKHRRG